MENSGSYNTQTLEELDEYGILYDRYRWGLVRNYEETLDPFRCMRYNIDRKGSKE